MTRTAWVGRRIAFLRQASGVTITVRPGDLDPRRPNQNGPLDLMTLLATHQRPAWHGWDAG